MFLVAKKGGEAYFRKYAGPRSDKIRKWVQGNEFLTVMVGALMPPPTPFKLVVIGSGAFEMSLRNFVFALTIARVIRYFGLGFLAVRYGDRAAEFVLQHKVVDEFDNVGSCVGILCDCAIDFPPETHCSLARILLLLK